MAKSSIQYQRPLTYIKADTTWNISVPPVYTSFEQYLGDNTKTLTGNNAKTLTGSGCSGEGCIFDQINCDINPGATVTIVNGCDRVFDKPIIIVEGFDPLNEIDYKYLLTNFKFYQFYENMRTSGYDFVFVDFTKNTDFIENNAKVLEQVIDNVNALKTGTNSSTIIGWSMGGLITRWCLKDMEDRGLTPNVGKFFSYDAPQQGANIPLGLQYMFSEMINDMPYLKWFSKDLREISNAYSSPAAREMLVTKALYSNDYPLPYTLDPVRTKFAQSLITKGYPQQSINYGIAFGRGNNTTGTKNAGDGVQFGNFGPGSAIFDGILKYLLFNMHGTSYAVPENSTNKICSYQFFGIKVAYLFGLHILPTVMLRSRNFNYHGQYPYDDGPGGYENTQTQFQDNFNDAIRTTGSVNLGGYATNYGHFGHAFIPTASALDLQNQGYGSVNLYQSNNMYGNIDNSIDNPGQVTGNTLNPSSLSPFSYVMTYTSDCGAVSCQSYDVAESSYEGTNWNLHHEAPISNQAAQFIERKILNALPPTNCPAICDYFTGISSNMTPICTTATLTLNSPYSISGYNIVWTVQNGFLNITQGQGTPVIHVSTNGSGTETVICTITNSCGQVNTQTLTIPVGNPLTGTINQGGVLTPMNTVNSVSAGAMLVNFQWPGVTGISCYQSSTNPPVSQTGFIYYPSNSEFWFTLSSGQSITVSFSGTGCGGTTVATRSFTVGGHYYVISPNPAYSSINITSNSPGNNSKIENAETGRMIQVSITDVNGNLKKQQQFSSGTTNMQLNVANLASGTYFVQITNGNINETQELIINR